MLQASSTGVATLELRDFYVADLKWNFKFDLYETQSIWWWVQKDGHWAVQGKGSVKEATPELGLDASRLSKWRNNPAFNGGKIIMDKPGLSEEQQEIRSLKKALKNAEL